MGTPQRLKVAVNFHEAELPKAGYTVQEMHSWHELLRVGRAERRPSVTALQTQVGPYRTATGRQHYVDLRYVGPSGPVFVEVLSSAALEAKRRWLEPLLGEIAAAEGATFEFSTHEDLDQEAAEDWACIEMTRWLCQYRSRDFHSARLEVLRAVRSAGKLTIGDLVHHLVSMDRSQVVVSVARLVHEGILLADLRSGFGPATTVGCA